MFSTLSVFQNPFISGTKIGIMQLFPLNGKLSSVGEITVGSWGPNSAVSPFVTEYKTIDIDILHSCSCPRQGFNSRTMFCAGTKKKTACPGDSGAAAFYLSQCNPILLGIVSYGFKECRGPAIYTRVNMYLDWIETVTGMYTVFLYLTF